MNPIGIMQGRLLPPSSGRIQSFPIPTWQREFFLMREAGLDCIEWVYQKETETFNPLRTDEGISEIQNYVKDSGVPVWSICADYYMKERLVSRGGSPQKNSLKHLQGLIHRVKTLGIRYIVLPFVDESSLKSPLELEGLRRILEKALQAAEKDSVGLHLETDLEARELVKILEEFSHPLLKVNYDIGDCASLGHNPVEELAALGRWLGSVHVKDRLLGGGSVPLGTGRADFVTCFRLIHEAGFQGFFILQAAREEGISEVELAIRNRRFVEEQLALVTGGAR